MDANRLPAIMQNRKNTWWQRALLVLGIFLLGLGLSTQTFAWLVRYHETLGWHWQNLYLPWQILVWTGYWLDVHLNLLMQASSVGICFASLSLIAMTMGQGFNQNLPVANDFLHGSARWADARDIARAGLDTPTGVYIGGYENKGKMQYLRHNGSEHLLCIAPTRSGKGICLVIPTLLSWMSSCVITDLKGELWALTAGWRQKHAHNLTLRFEPASKNSLRWNPLDEIRIETDYEISDTQNLATMIVDPDGKGLNDHWQKTSQALLVGCILHVCYLRQCGKPEFASLAGIDAMLADPSRQNPDPTKPNLGMWEDMKKFCHKGDTPHPIVARAAQDMIDRPEQERGSVLSTAKSYLSLFRDKVVADNTSASDFKIRDLMYKNPVDNPEGKPVSLYIVTQPVDKERLRPLVRIMINMICRLLAEQMDFEDTPAPPSQLDKMITDLNKRSSTRFLARLLGFVSKPALGSRRGKSNYQHKLLMMMDEFPSLGRLDIVQESLAFLAGYGIRFYIICQDITQLKSEHIGYGKDEAISSNCHIQNAFQPNRLETAQYLSELTGQTTIIKEQLTVSGQRLGVLNSVSKTLNEVARPLMTPDECMRMTPPIKKGENLIKGGDMLIYLAGFPAIRGQQMPYFLDPVFQARSMVDPPNISDKIRKAV